MKAYQNQFVALHAPLNLQGHISTEIAMPFMQDNGQLQPPSVEIGLSKSQQLQVLHIPQLHSVTATGEMGSAVDLTIQKHTANLEGTILQAAACNANIQLGMNLISLPLNSQMASSLHFCPLRSYFAAMYIILSACLWSQGLPLWGLQASALCSEEEPLLTPAHEN